MTSDDIINVKNAVIAFNKAKTWDEFLVKLDLIGMSLRELEMKYYEYYEMMSAIDNAILKKILENLKMNSKTISLEKVFSTCVTSSCSDDLHIHLALPVRVEYDNDNINMCHDMKVYYDEHRYVALNLDLLNDIHDMHGIDANAEMANTVIYELAMENSR